MSRVCSLLEPLSFQLRLENIFLIPKLVQIKETLLQVSVFDEALSVHLKQRQLPS